MSKQQFPHKILWLASYPKSGNTWFRAFLSALLYEEVEINKLRTNGIFSARDTFELITDIDSRDLYDEEAKRVIADVYREVAAEKNHMSIIKVHDFFGTDADGRNIIPEDVTHCAIYFIRNPLDIAGSLANHNNSTIDEAVAMLNNPNAYLSAQLKNLNRHNQFSQYLSDWSGHVNSWTIKPTFPVHVVRYEDMLADSFNTFSKVISDIGWEYSPEQIKKAIEASSFEKLSRQEAESGFAEKFAKSPKFFRGGTMKNWEKELTPEQIIKIKETHKDLLEKYRY